MFFRYRLEQLTIGLGVLFLSQFARIPQAFSGSFAARFDHRIEYVLFDAIEDVLSSPLLQIPGEIMAFHAVHIPGTFTTRVILA